MYSFNVEGTGEVHQTPLPTPSVTSGNMSAEDSIGRDFIIDSSHMVYKYEGQGSHIQGDTEPSDSEEYSNVSIHQTDVANIQKQKMKHSALDLLNPVNNMAMVREQFYQNNDTMHRYLQTILIGVVVGLYIAVIKMITNELSTVKWNLMYGFDVKWHSALAFLGWSLVCGACGAIIVTIISPLSNSSGIPDIKQYLNGVNIPDCFSSKTFICKTISIIFSVQGAVPAGSQGPSIHFGAFIGGWLSAKYKQVVVAVCCCRRHHIDELRDPEDRPVQIDVVPRITRTAVYPSLVQNAIQRVPVALPIAAGIDYDIQTAWNSPARREPVTVNGDQVPSTQKEKRAQAATGEVRLIKTKKNEQNEDIQEFQHTPRSVIGRPEEEEQLGEGAELGSRNQEDRGVLAGNSGGCAPRAWRRHIVPGFASPLDRRWFQSCGAAAGMASALGASVGSALYVLEELGPGTFNTGYALALQACAVASNTTTAIASSLAQGKGIQAFEPDSTSSFFAGRRRALQHTEEIPQFVVLGVQCGQIGGAWLRFNAVFAKIRARITQKKTLIAVTQCTILLWAFIECMLPLALPCVRTSPRFAVAEQLSEGGGDAYSTIDYACPRQGLRNPIAELSFTRFEVSAKRLFARGTPTSFSPGILLLWLQCLFVFSVFTSHLALTPGVLLPFIMQGAVTGRLFGVVLNYLVNPASDITADTLYADPGIYASAGAAAMLGAISQTPLSMTVVMLEVTMDWNLLLPMLISSSVAYIVTHTFGITYYEYILHSKKLNYQPLEPTHEMKLLQCKDIMVQRPVCLGVQEPVEHVLEVLATCKHHGFAVIAQPCAKNVKGNLYNEPYASTHRGEDKDKQLVGVIQRKDLLQLLNRRVWLPNSKPFHPTEFERLRNSAVPTIEELHSRLTSDDLRACIDLVPWMDKSATFVHEDTDVATAYTIFRHMNLRHLPVVNYHQHITGVITRMEVIPSIVLYKYELSQIDILARVRNNNALKIINELEATRFTPAPAKPLILHENAVWDDPSITDDPEEDHI